jgi:hypothetical protein
MQLEVRCLWSVANQLTTDHRQQTFINYLPKYSISLGNSIQLVAATNLSFLTS